jgi:hypothetical protein
MTNPEPDNGATRDDLVQRLELMESMIAEGRQSTCRYGWVFFLWGLINLTGRELDHHQPGSEWVWPTCLATGAVITIAGMAMQKRHDSGSRSMRSRSVGAVWAMMGITMALYVGSALATHFTWQYSYAAAIGMFVGMAHAISASILRWRAQALVAAVWWAGGVSIFFFNSRRAANNVFLIEMCLGMMAFGLYAMWLERRNGGQWVNRNA